MNPETDDVDNDDTVDDDTKTDDDADDDAVVDDTRTDDGTVDDDADDGTPGFGIVAALVAMLAAVTLVRRTRS